MSDLYPPPSPERPHSRLAALQAEIDRARRELAEAWEGASSADRIFAVDRLLREDGLHADAGARLAALHARVRDAWVEARVSGLSAAGTAARQAALRLLLAERELDALLEASGLFEPLFLAAEGFLRRVPAARGRSLKELTRERERELERQVHFVPAHGGAA
ncbi:MAG: hypothetical protein HYS27_19630 [Deltaproteobacteria bacterium]|nr:hypothetical protein [Deltaproteobacteria bacterium]